MCFFTQILKSLQDNLLFVSNSEIFLGKVVFIPNSQLKYLQDNLLCRIEGQDQELAKGGEDEVTMLTLVFG